MRLAQRAILVKQLVETGMKLLTPHVVAWLYLGTILKIVSEFQISSHTGYVRLMVEWTYFIDFNKTRVINLFFIKCLLIINLYILLGLHMVLSSLMRDLHVSEIFNEFQNFATKNSLNNKTLCRSVFPYRYYSRVSSILD